MTQAPIWGVTKNESKTSLYVVSASKKIMIEGIITIPKKKQPKKTSNSFAILRPDAILYAPSVTTSCALNSMLRK